MWPGKQERDAAPEGRPSSSRVAKPKRRTPHPIPDSPIHSPFSSGNRDLGTILAPAHSNESVVDTRNTLATNDMTTLSLQCLPWESRSGDQCGDFCPEEQVLEHPPNLLYPMEVGPWTDGLVPPWDDASINYSDGFPGQGDQVLGVAGMQKSQRPSEHRRREVPRYAS